MSIVKNQSNHLRNPDFDDDIVIWEDKYSGKYESVCYGQQFDEQWRLFLERKQGFHDHTGVEIADPYIDDRIFELTGIQGVLEKKKFRYFYPLVAGWRYMLGLKSRRNVGGRLHLSPKFPINYFEGKRCLDIGCGPGRWTKTLMTLGANVVSTEVSENALRSVKSFNVDTYELDIFDIPAHTEFIESFDFTMCWGVMQHTHDPKIAFKNAAATVKAGGSLYVMAYAPTYHASDYVRDMRRKFHRECQTVDEKIKFVYEIAEDPNNAINYLDMLNTFYNWTIPEDTIHNWFKDCGFENIKTLNKQELHNAAWHVLGVKRKD